MSHLFGPPLKMVKHNKVVLFAEALMHPGMVKQGPKVRIYPNVIVAKFGQGPFFLQKASIGIYRWAELTKIRDKELCCILTDCSQKAVETTADLLKLLSWGKLKKSYYVLKIVHE